MFADADEYLPSADKWVLHIYCILFTNTSLERYVLRKKTVVHKNSKFPLKVHYTLIKNKMLVAFAFRSSTILLYTLSCINNIELKCERNKYNDLLDDGICATYIRILYMYMRSY